MAVYSIFYISAMVVLIIVVEKRKRYFDKHNTWKGKNKITYY